MPYNLRQRYNLRERGQTQKAWPPTTQMGKHKGQAAEQHPGSARKGAHRGARRQDNRNTTRRPAAARKDRKKQQPPRPSGNDEVRPLLKSMGLAVGQTPPPGADDDMHPLLKAMGYETLAFIPDPEHGLKEGEEPPPPFGTVEEEDPDLLNYGPWPPESVPEIDPEFRKMAKENPSPWYRAWLAGWDRMHAPRD
ncbi:hypothetical protein FQN55_003902 [Onygenales sp. PD_40]|nr:hypothetical protein FQN55_003902 [Onygenales sp. PD_40]